LIVCCGVIFIAGAVALAATTNKRLMSLTHDIWKIHTYSATVCIGSSLTLYQPFCKRLFKADVHWLYDNFSLLSAV